MNIDKKPSDRISEIELENIRPFQYNKMSDIERLEARIECIIQYLDEMFIELVHDLKGKPLT